MKIDWLDLLTVLLAIGAVVFLVWYALRVSNASTTCKAAGGVYLYQEHVCVDLRRIEPQREN